jgi:CTP synthase
VCVCVCLGHAMDAMDAIDAMPALPAHSLLISPLAITHTHTHTSSYERLHDTVSIALVGKYTHLQDSYISVVKSLQHAALSCNRKLTIQWIEASDLEEGTQSTDPVKYHESWKKLCSVQGILVPGGFGGRGTEGKMNAAKWARENRVPYLGICLGLQIAVIEFARNVCGLTGANYTEMDADTAHPVVINMPEISTTQLGGTMRLGDRPTHFTPGSAGGSVVRKLYGEELAVVHERHRHRYEVNPAYVAQLEARGCKFIGRDEKGERMIILELEGRCVGGGVLFECGCCVVWCHLET